MKHLLDNPIWNALIFGNKSFSNGNEIAKYFSPEMSPLVGMIENNSANFEILYETIPFKEQIVYFSDDRLLKPFPWNITLKIDGFQMVYGKAMLPNPNNKQIIALSDMHVPEMMALAELTKPGPFSAKTIQFGNYEGVYDGNKLVAMAGQRLNVGSNIEISAVCTHANYLGRGYARQLVTNQIYNIQQQGCVAYLHVRADNIRAIKVYEDLGFIKRKEIFFYIMRKEK